MPRRRASIVLVLFRQGAAHWLPPAFRPRSRGRGLARGYLREGDCPAGAEPVAKVIGALPGDVVEVEPGFVAVNGVKFPNSQTAARDSAGRPLAHVLSGAHRVGAGEVWLFGFNNARSWDARYFGPVPAGECARRAAASGDVVKGGGGEEEMSEHSEEQGLRVHHLVNLGGLIAIAGLDREPPDFLLGALISVAHERERADARAADAGGLARAAKTR